MAIDPLTNEEGKEPQEKDYTWFNEQFEKSYIDLNKKPKRPDGVISIGKQTGFDGNEYPNYIFTKGELSVISAPSKSFKSTLKSHLASVYFTGQSEEFSEIKGHRKGNETVVDIDTEMGEWNAWNTFYRTKRLCKDADLSEMYYPFKLRHMNAEKRVEFIDILLESRKIGIPALIFIDGIADLIDDTNDLQMSNNIVSTIMRWTDEYKINVCNIIHNAYGSDKPTGHLGSAVTKKAETVINMKETEKGSNVFEAHHQYSRGAKFEDFHFMHDNKQKKLYQVDSPDNNQPTENVPY